jgi:uncharacterized protein YqcC (DUF446 family)
MNIQEEIINYIGEDTQTKLATDINEVKGYQYISRMSVSNWVNGIHLPTLKTAIEIRDAAPQDSELWQLFDSIVKELEDVRMQVKLQPEI